MPLARHVVKETVLMYKKECRKEPKTETVHALVPLRARLEAWSMGCRDSDIGDKPASVGVIPFGRLSFLLHPCLQLDTAHRTTS